MTVSGCIACWNHPTHWVDAGGCDEPLCEVHYRELNECLSDCERRFDEMVAGGVHPLVAHRILIVELERAA